MTGQRLRQSSRKHFHSLPCHERAGAHFDERGRNFTRAQVRHHHHRCRVGGLRFFGSASYNRKQTRSKGKFVGLHQKVARKAKLIGIRVGGNKNIKKQQQHKKRDGRAAEHAKLAGLRLLFRGQNWIDISRGLLLRLLRTRGLLFYWVR